ncbi:hypothetical protein [Capnocytophaga stomatis]|uniref:Lipoprotein n=1 Tax=Capnocytophaga stomatis TaxID=1848904 RepID=A0A250FWX3_9FLAO|nr:hypothetical protein [Capnocytophaga stomatis]ATA89652.1 hypothetical protein CGC58_07845 [Capnocytophaga stomatis]GIJ97347.1 hypothetical protein CAPN001_19160 [Capnocytophaga stomatis]GIM49205.1 hypothetical protein CAPN003_06570 [Capnocytophaga stomatis]
MKKVLFLGLSLIALACREESNECCSPPPVFNLYINKNSESYKEFLNSEGKFDTKNVSLYRLNGNVKKEYTVEQIYLLLQEKYLSVGTHLDYKNDIYTGKKETLYLKNASKTYKIEVEGEMVSRNGCCPVAELKEIKVDGVKIENYFLVK